MLGANSAIKNIAFLGQHEAHTFPFCISRNVVYYNCRVSGRLAVTFFPPSFCPALDEHLHDGAIKLYPLQNHTFIVLVCKKAAQGFCGWQCGLTTRRFWLFVAFLCGFPELVSSGYSGWYSNMQVGLLTILISFVVISRIPSCVVGTYSTDKCCVGQMWPPTDWLGGPVAELERQDSLGDVVEENCRCAPNISCSVGPPFLLSKCLQ